MEEKITYNDLLGAVSVSGSGRTVPLEAIKRTDIGSWSVKDNSVRGFRVVYASQLKIGDEVIINNYFTKIV